MSEQTSNETLQTLISDVQRQTELLSLAASNPSVNRLIKALKDQNEGLFDIIKDITGDHLKDLVIKLAGDLITLRGIAAIEKRRGDQLELKVKELEAQYSVEEPQYAAQRKSQKTIGIVANWLAFVREQTDYTKSHGGDSWPSVADALHSSLLARMMKGETPMPKDKYDDWKNPK